MRKTPQPKMQRLYVIGDSEGGGCVDLGQIMMHPSVGVYSTHEIEEMRIYERMFFVKYLQSVLLAIGHNREEQASNVD